MKTEKCEEMMNRFLIGDRSADLVKHLSECSRCRDLAALSGMVSENAPRIQVPAELDQAILSYASAKKRPAGKVLDFASLMRHALIPAAAAVMVCMGLTFAFQSQKYRTHNSLVHARISNSVFPYDPDSLDSDLLVLSSRIQDAAAQLNRTAVYVMDEQNGGLK